MLTSHFYFIFYNYSSGCLPMYSGCLNALLTNLCKACIWRILRFQLKDCKYLLPFAYCSLFDLFHFDNPKHFANWKQNISFLVAICNGKAFSFSNSGPPATKQLKMHLLGIMGISFLKKEPIYYSNLTKAAKGFAEGIPSYF